MTVKRIGTLSLILWGLAGSSTRAWWAQDETVELELTLERAIQMALENNLDIVVSRLGTQVQTQTLAVARGVYKPLLNLNLNTQRERNPATNQLSGAETVRNVTTGFNVSWEQLLPTGGRYAVSFDNARISTNSTFFSINPRYDALLSAQVTQPLLKDFGLDPNKQQIVVAQNGERVSRHQFQAQVMDSVREVENAYWDLVASIEGLEVAQKSLELAQDLLRNNRIQVEVGTMAPIDVLEAEAEVAAREEAVILAEEAIFRNEDLLKRLINDPESSNFWAMELRPADSPIRDPIGIDVAESVSIAEQRRPELESSRVELETRDYNVRYTRNQLRPQVDLVGSLAYDGVGGDLLIREGFGGAVVERIEGGYGDALDQIFGGDFRDLSLGLQVTYPLGNSTEEAAHARAQVELRRQRASVENQELLIAQEVRQAARQVETNLKRIEATTVARELAQRRLEAEEKKFEVGMSTSFLIVQAQRDLTEAEANEVRAVIDYNKAIVEFERARGTLLDRLNINIR